MKTYSQFIGCALLGVFFAAPLLAAPDSREAVQARAAWEQAEQKLQEKWQAYRSKEREVLRLEEEWLKALDERDMAHMRVWRARQDLASPRRDWDNAQRKNTYGAPKRDWEAADKALKKWIDYDKKLHQQLDNINRLQEVALRKQQAWQEGVKRLRATLDELRKEEEEVAKKRAAWVAEEKKH